MFETSHHGAFVEAAFGAFSEHPQLAYISQAFYDAFDPITLPATYDSWRRVRDEGFQTPLDFTRLKIEARYYDDASRTVFILDPRSTLDLIDLWNLRLFRRDVLPVPLTMLDEAKECFGDAIGHRPKHTLEDHRGFLRPPSVIIARSLSKETIHSIHRDLLDHPSANSWLPAGYDAIWWENRAVLAPRTQRCQVFAERSALELTASGEVAAIRFQSLSPAFAEHHGGDSSRWANVLSIRVFGQTTGLATFFPSSIQDPHRSTGIRLAGPLFLSREGFVLPQRYKDSQEYLRLPSCQDAIIKWLGRRGVLAAPSDPGRVADQMLSAVGGFIGAGILAHKETLQLLDKMAKSIRIRRGEAPIEWLEEYPERTSSWQEWTSLLAKRSEVRGDEVTVDDFVKAGALRLGLAIACPRCDKGNWYGLRELNDRVDCARCLQSFTFPQGALDLNRTPWRFRLAGPFSVPDFAGGAYTTILCLRLFAKNLDTALSEIIHATSLTLTIADAHSEIDFAFWYRREVLSERLEDPVLVVGEAKSFADKAILETDIQRLKGLSSRVPGAFLVVAVLKAQFSPDEKRLLVNLAVWGRYRLASGEQRAPLIVLTGLELLSQEPVSWVWEQVGGEHARLVRLPLVQLDNLETFADLTQQLYLDMPSYQSHLMQESKGARAADQQPERGRQSEARSRSPVQGHEE
jgi:hypothetical protein